MDKNRVRPFYCGGQFSDWTSTNCDRCTKGSHLQSPDEWPRCPLEAALTEAYVGDGTIDQDIATRIGYVPLASYNWPCAEFEATVEWKAEYERRHSQS